MIERSRFAGKSRRTRRGRIIVRSSSQGFGDVAKEDEEELQRRRRRRRKRRKGKRERGQNGKMRKNVGLPILIRERNIACIII